MYRWADEDRTTIQRIGDGAFIPRGGVLFLQVEAWEKEGNAIADFEPDPEIAKGAKRAAAREGLLDALLTSDKPLDQVVTEARSKMALADTVDEVAIGVPKHG